VKVIIKKPESRLPDSPKKYTGSYKTNPKKKYSLSPKKGVEAGKVIFQSFNFLEDFWRVF